MAARPRPEPETRPEASARRRSRSSSRRSRPRSARATETFLLERLNPATLDLYGESGNSKALIATLKDSTRAYEIRKTSKPKPYDCNPDGRSITVPNVYTVTVQVTANGELSKQEIHFAPVTDTLTWFADCGDPTS